MVATTATYIHNPLNISFNDDDDKNDNDNDEDNEEEFVCGLVTWSMNGSSSLGWIIFIEDAGDDTTHVNTYISDGLMSGTMSAEPIACSSIY